MKHHSPPKTYAMEKYLIEVNKAEIRLWNTMEYEKEMIAKGFSRSKLGLDYERLRDEYAYSKPL